MQSCSDYGSAAERRRCPGCLHAVLLADKPNAVHRPSLVTPLNRLPEVGGSPRNRYRPLCLCAITRKTYRERTCLPDWTRQFRPVRAGVDLRRNAHPACTEGIRTLARFPHREWTQGGTATSGPSRQCPDRRSPAGRCTSQAVLRLGPVQGERHGGREEARGESEDGVQQTASARKSSTSSEPLTVPHGTLGRDPVYDSRPRLRRVSARA